LRYLGSLGFNGGKRGRGGRGIFLYVPPTTHLGCSITYLNTYH